MGLVRLKGREHRGVGGRWVRDTEVEAERRREGSQEKESKTGDNKDIQQNNKNFNVEILLIKVMVPDNM